WTGGSESLTLVALLGNEAPDTPSGVVYSGYFSPPALNTAGHIAFGAGLHGSSVNSSNNSGIWSDRSGSLDLVLRTGSQAPGALEGVVFASHFEPLVLNSAGQIAFKGFLSGDGVDFSNSSG